MNINDILTPIFLSAVMTAIIVYIFHNELKHILQSIRHAIFPARYLKKAERKPK